MNRRHTRTQVEWIAGTLFLAGPLLWVSLARPVGWLVVVHIAYPWITVAIGYLFPRNFTLSFDRESVDKRARRFPLPVLWTVNTPLTLAIFPHARLNVFDAFVLGLPIGFALFLVAGLRKEQPPRRLGASIVLLLICGAYGHGVVRELDISFDRSNGFVNESKVVRKRLDRLVFSIYVAPWRSNDEVEHIGVPESVYHALVVNGPVCMVTKKGALWIPWHTAQVCPWTGSTLFP